MGKDLIPLLRGLRPSTTSEKSEEEKGNQGTEDSKPPTPTRAIHALIGEEEQNEKQKK